MINSKSKLVSIIIPTYNDPFLQKTIDSLLANAVGMVEIIAILDGYTPMVPIKKDPRLTLIKFKKNRGMRAAINAGIKKAKGKFLMKCDSHCSLCPNYDKIMAKNCKSNWLMIPRRYSLDTQNWNKARYTSGIDYHYMSFPVPSQYGTTFTIASWQERKYGGPGAKLNIDDTMIFQGSLWFANRKYFIKHVGLLKYGRKTYSSFGCEQVEIGLKYWLGGGRVKIIKSVWYAHLGKRSHHYSSGIFSREYKLSRDAVRGRTWCAKHWMNNEEPNMIHPFTWLVEKFWPIPDWPTDRKLWVLR